MLEPAERPDAIEQRAHSDDASVAVEGGVLPVSLRELT